MGSPWYKIMLGMSYYIHAGGLGALKALPGSVSKRVTPVAVIVLAGGPLAGGYEWAHIVRKGKPPAAIQKVTMLIALSILDLVGPLPSFTPGGRILEIRKRMAFF